jgi:hypothetical protein
VHHPTQQQGTYPLLSLSLSLCVCVSVCLILLPLMAVFLPPYPTYYPSHQKSALTPDQFPLFLSLSLSLSVCLYVSLTFLPILNSDVVTFNRKIPYISSFSNKCLKTCQPRRNAFITELSTVPDGIPTLYHNFLNGVKVSGKYLTSSVFVFMSFFLS